MADSIPGPWICDYLVEVAENHGAQFFNESAFSRKKKVQLIDFLTFHEESHIWAWVSDVTHTIPIRICKEGAEDYKNGSHGRKVTDSRFAVVFIAKFKPMFAPRPRGGNQKGNTPLSHIALEVSEMAFVGFGSHTLGDPKDVESNELVREWVAGLRQDGGGGNVLQLRKWERQAAETQNSALAPSGVPVMTHIDTVSKPASPNVTRKQDARPQPSPDFKHMYSKRWRVFELNPWKFACKPIAPQTQIGEVPQTHSTVRTESVDARLSGLSRCKDVPAPLLEDRHSAAQAVPHTPSKRPAAHARPSTPTDWSPSLASSPILRARSSFHDMRPLSPHIQRDTEIGDFGTETTEITTQSQAWFVQPPTPAQRNRSVSILPSQSWRRSPPLPSSPLSLNVPLHNLPLDIKYKIPPPQALDGFFTPTPEKTLPANHRRKRKLSGPPVSLQKRPKKVKSQGAEWERSVSSSVTPTMRQPSVYPGSTETSRQVSVQPEEYAGDGEYISTEEVPCQMENCDVQETIQCQNPLEDKRSRRLAGLIMDFGQIPCDPNHLRPRMSWTELRTILLKTGRVRTFGKGLEQDGSVYIRPD